MFAIVDSKTPIYSRIIHSIQIALDQVAESCVIIKPESICDLIRVLQEIRFEAVFVTNDFSELNIKVSTTSRFIFEYCNSPLIFIHHDSSFCRPADIDHSISKIQALKSVANRSLHFVIEESNVSFYSNIGVPVRLIHHSSEFDSNYLPSAERRSHSLSLVGHVAPFSCNYISADQPLKYSLIWNYWNRINNANFRVQESFAKMVDEFRSKGKYPSVGDHYQVPKLPHVDPSGELHRSGYLQALMHEFTKLSLSARGDYLRLIPDEHVVIFGGDPSGGQIKGAQLSEEHIEYRPHTSTKETLEVYQSSLVSLNLHSLQFDSAYNNRVVDVFLGGGFCLSDFKARLLDVTCYAEFFTFSSPSEFCEKVEFLQTALGRRQIDEITPLIREDFRRKCTYRQVLSDIISEWKIHFGPHGS